MKSFRKKLASVAFTCRLRKKLNAAAYHHFNLQQVFCKSVNKKCCFYFFTKKVFAIAIIKENVIDL